MQQSFNEDDLSSSPQGGGLNIKPYLKTARRNIILIAATTILIGAVAYIKNSSAPPVYGAGFRLLVEPVNTEAQLTDPSALARDGGGIDRRELDYGTQLEILQSPQVLREIVDKVKTQFPTFGYGQLKNNLLIERSGNTKIIDVSFAGSDPDLVQLVLDETAARFLQYSLEERKSRIGEGVRFIEDQLPDLQERANNLEDQIQQLQQEYFVADPATEGANLATQIRDLSTQQSTTQRDLLEQQTLYQTLQDQLGLSPEQAIAASAVSEDPAYQAILAQLQDINTQIATESARFSEASPPIQALRARQDNLMALLDEQASRIIGPILSEAAVNDPQIRAFQNSIRQGLIQQLVQTINQIRILEVRLQDITASRARLEQQAKNFPAISRRYLSLQRELQITTSNLDQLLSQRETLRIEAAQSTVPWELISEPQVPVDENGNAVPEPGDSKLLLMGIVGGAALGFGIGFLLEKLRDIFFDAEEVQDAMEPKVLGSIPYCHFIHKIPALLNEGDRINKRQKTDIATFLESFNSLYASIRFQCPPAIRSFVITSPSIGDGKTIITYYLAQAFAAVGQKVLIVDANLRLPSLHDLAKVSNQKGLNDILMDGFAVEDVIQPVPNVRNLSILPAGLPTANAPQLLASDHMAQVAKDLVSRFDLVIYDAPSLVGFMDSIFLSAHTNGVLMTLSVKQTKQSATAHAMGELEKYSVPVLGVVVNRVRDGSAVSVGDRPAKPKDKDELDLGLEEEELEQDPITILKDG
jgi:capsular exopolysaccharide synthesis family protein